MTSTKNSKKRIKRVHLLRSRVSIRPSTYSSTPSGESPPAISQLNPFNPFFPSIGYRLDRSRLLRSRVKSFNPFFHSIGDRLDRSRLLRSRVAIRFSTCGRTSVAAGFTLIETVIALVILSASLVLLATGWSSSLIRVRKAQRTFEISTMLERKMVEIDLKYRGKSLDEIEEDADGEFEGVEDYKWKMHSQKLEIPDISSLVGAKQGENGADPLTLSLIKQLSEGLSKCIKEVRVTVTYTKLKKPLEVSATEYFVDYDKDIQFGVPGG